MSQACRAAVQWMLPQATITADTFHVIARVNEGLACVGNRLMKGRKRSDSVRCAARLVLHNREHLDTEAGSG